LVITLNYNDILSFQLQRPPMRSRNRYSIITAENDGAGDCYVSSSSSSSSSSQEMTKLTLDETENNSIEAAVVEPQIQWYSHPDIERDRTHVQQRYNSLSDILNRYQEEQQQENCNSDSDNDNTTNDDISNGSKFLLISSEGMWHQTSSLASGRSVTTASPLYLTVTQLVDVLSRTNTAVSSTFSIDNDDNQISIMKEEPLIAYVGKYQDMDYWVVHLKDGGNKDDERIAESQFLLKSTLSTSTMISSGGKLISQCKPLREFGDSLESSHDAGILATANGLVEFHKSHGYCSRCGGSTKSSKAGGSRTCTNESCRRSVYPRIDSATIMLVTSPCENYALLGRKKSWPAGRYSTLAGFTEVGETLEECCRRETFEESGVLVDPASVRFEASQPWPFPRSLMVGFRAKAMSTVTSTATTVVGESNLLPEIIVDTNEMEDIRWFAKEFVKERLSLDGSTALTFQPNAAEAEFHIPGKASLARYLISRWTDENI
jgi:NADH pyrophosphatase NudC (nudix superfamily)